MSLEEKLLSSEERAKRAIKEIEEQESTVAVTLEKYRREKQDRLNAMESEIHMIRKKVYSFDELLDYLKLLYQSGGDDAVVQYLLIFGKVAEIDDRIDSLDEIESALWEYDSDMMFSLKESRRDNPELDRIFKRREDLFKKRNILTNSIGMMADSMFGYKRNHSKYKYL